MAMRINFYEEVLGSVQQRNENVLSQELEKWEKVVLSLCIVVKRKLLEYII